MKITLEKACEILKAHDNILILSHQNPDGDTLGSAFALYGGLKTLGKRSRIACSDDFPKRYDFMYEGYEEQKFTPEIVVAVDLADTQLFGDKYSHLADKVELCIDHHPSNALYAKATLVRPEAAATCEIIYDLLLAMGVKLNSQICTCLYTGIATDTGCFRYSNTTANTHSITAKLMQYDVPVGKINRLMFETKTQSRISIEKQVLNTVEYYYDKRCALIYITLDMLKTSGADESELDGVSTIPRQIEGVELGVTLREKPNGQFKISLRTNDGFDASKICGTLGGGGHMKAAGCTVEGDLAAAKRTILDAIAKFID